MTESDRVITLRGWFGAAWESGGTFTQTGTRQQLESFFRENMATGYNLKNQELVSPEFFYKVGESLFAQLEHKDLLAVTGTVTALNKRMRDTGRPQFLPQDSLYQALTIIESDEFASVSPEDRLNMLGEELRITSVWTASSRFMPMKHDFLLNPQYNFKEKYPDLEPTIEELWQQEVCEKSIYPFLATL